MDYASILFNDTRPLPILPVVDHYAGSEKLIRKALILQGEQGPIFDITCDCEDGAPTGHETEHARMCAELINSAENLFGRVAARIHDITHPHWKMDLEILIRHAGARLAFITFPKPRSFTDVTTQLAELQRLEELYGLLRPIPIHVMIETHGALHDVWKIAALERVESLDFGIMDFISDHQGAIPATAMTSPGQFNHPLIVRAKCEMVAAALGNNIIPTHNVCTELKDQTYIFQDARRARQELGFLRMWSIHPHQISAIIDALRPDFSEVADAIAILRAAQEQSWGPIKYQGKLHDRASYRYYWQLFQRAKATGMKDLSIAP